MFRIEDKLSININQAGEFVHWLKNKKAKKIYPDRKINSLYFENPNNDLFLDSEEGCVPRKKIRIRNYPNSKEINFYLEIKISSTEGRFKKSFKINQKEYYKFIKLGYFDNHYGNCLPKVFISYSRQYFSLFDCRITIDQSINYKKFNSNLNKIFDKMYVVEIKSNNIFMKDNLLNFFPFERIRFSKYCRSFAYLG